MTSPRAALLVSAGLAALMLSTPVCAAEEYDDAAPIVVVGAADHYRTDDVDATKTGTALRDTPQSVAVIGREQLDDQAVEQLNDALRYVPGVTLGQGEGHRDQVVLRGQSSTADFFLDGLRDDAQYYRPLYNTQRVEVLKGANALLFGRGGGGGIINRVSKVSALHGTHGSMAAGADSWGAWSLAGDLDLALADNAGLRINATYEDFANHRDSYQGSFTGFAPSLTARFGERTLVTLAYEYDRDRRVTDRGVPSLGGVPIQGYDRTFFGSSTINQSRVDAHVVRTRIDHELGDQLTLSVSGQFADYDKYYANVLPAGTSATTVTLSGYDNGVQRRNWIGQANLVWKGQTGPIGQTLLAGIEGGQQDTLSTRRDVLFGAARTLTGTVPLARVLSLPVVDWTPINRASSSDVRSLSAYLQDQIELAPWLQVIVGARYDDFRIDSRNTINGFTASRSDGKWSPRLGLVIKPREQISLYASYAKSFLPQSGDQFTVLDATTATLAPEAFRNLELGVKWDPAAQLSFTAALFQVDRANTRSNDPLTGNPVLTGKSRVRGFEAGMAGQVLPQWQISLGYTWQEGEIRSATTAAPAGRQLDKLPHHQFSAWTRYDLTGKFGLGLGLVHQSGQWATISNAVRLPGFTRLDAALFYDLNDRVAVQLNVENLTDARYYPSAHTDHNISTGEPINARLTLRLKL